MRYSYSEHAKVAAAERAISDDIVKFAIDNPDIVERNSDGTIHHCKRFDNLTGRWLRVVLNDQKEPPMIVTVFFDRRLRRQK